MERNQEEQIRRRAYEIWEQTGRPDGRDREHWLQAEAEINGPKRLESGSAVAAPAAGRRSNTKRRSGPRWPSLHRPNLSR